jgi:hypothetical protein
MTSMQLYSTLALGTDRPKLKLRKVFHVYPPHPQNRFLGDGRTLKCNG